MLVHRPESRHDLPRPLKQPERDNHLMRRYFREIDLPGKRLVRRSATLTPGSTRPVPATWGRKRREDQSGPGEHTRPLQTGPALPQGGDHGPPGQPRESGERISATAKLSGSVAGRRNGAKDRAVKEFLTFSRKTSEKGARSLRKGLNDSKSMKTTTEGE